jgi:hypothetical protein
VGSEDSSSQGDKAVLRPVCLDQGRTDALSGFRSVRVSHAKPNTLGTWREALFQQS